MMIVSTPSFLEVSLTNEEVVNLEKYAKNEDYLPIGSTPVISIKPKIGIDIHYGKFTLVP